MSAQSDAVLRIAVDRGNERTHRERAERALRRAQDKLAAVEKARQQISDETARMKAVWHSGHDRYDCGAMNGMGHASDILDRALGAAVTPTPQDEKAQRVMIRHAPPFPPTGEQEIVADLDAADRIMAGCVPGCTLWVRGDNEWVEVARPSGLQPVVCGCGHTMACHNAAVPEDQTGCIADDYPCRTWGSAPSGLQRATEQQQ